MATDVTSYLIFGVKILSSNWGAKIGIRKGKVWYSEQNKLLLGMTLYGLVAYYSIVYVCMYV